MPSASTLSKRDIKKEYKQILKPKQKLLTFLFSQTIRCLHCSWSKCQHLHEIINAAAVANKTPKPYPQIPCFTFTISDIFDFMKPLTKGAFGQLFLVKHKPSGRMMVAKVISLAEAFVKSNEVLQSYIQERNTMLRCQHPNIIKLYYSFRSEYFIYQVSKHKLKRYLLTLLDYGIC